MPPPIERGISLQQLGQLFLKLGMLGFGGPLAHIALIQDEVVGKRNWLPMPQFLEGLTLSQILPGPLSTKLAIYIGYRLRGYRGAVVSGSAFILPAFILLLGLTWAYFRFGAFPAVQGLFYGMIPVVLALILVSCLRLAKVAADSRELLAILGGGAMLVALFSFNLLLLFAGAAITGWILHGKAQAGTNSSAFLSALVPLPLLFDLAWYFLKVGSVIFGGGLVIIPFIEREVVGTLGWLTRKEFLDGLALGQITPGPVVITATFIGYKVAGWLGAVVATVSIFLPSFVLTFVGAAYLDKIRRSARVAASLQAVNAVAVGAILGSLVPLSRQSLSDPFGLVLFASAVVALVRYKVNFLHILAVGALFGWLAWMLGNG